MTVAPISTLILSVIIFTAGAPIIVGQENAPLSNNSDQLVASYEVSMDRLKAPLKELKKSYQRRLETLKTAQQKQGNLNGVVAIQAELKRLEKESPGLGSSFKPLAESQAIYHNHAEKINSRINSERIRNEEVFIKSLKMMIEDLTRKGQIEVALNSQKHLKVAEERLKGWRSVPGEWDRKVAKNSFNWIALRKLIKDNKLRRTGSVGGSPGKLDLEIPVEGTLLVGFDVYLGKFGDSDETVRKIVPLYRTEAGKIMVGRPRSGAKADKKRRLIAKSGYVVAGITTYSEIGLRKMKVRFEAINGMGTDSKKHYDSDWYGEWKDGRMATLTTDGRLPVGIEGAIGLGIGETRLIVLDVK
ncbi:MAG: hypothetical protein GXP30_08190 [Verrucomicrobia bacterium]|nr:hypothetical protein [Verrucomicrobiota bacterium]